VTLSIGIAGSLPAETIRRIAPIVEAVGYRALWINDTPGGDALDALATAAEVTTTLQLATGVVALDRRSGAEIAQRVRDLPADRVRIGVGTGQARHGLALLETAVGELRDGCDVPVLVGALGPRTRALAARIADGILFTWLTPATAAAAMTQLRADAGGRSVEGVLYARTIASPEARPALEAEAARYASYPQYAANFARLGIDPIDTTIDLTRPGAARAFQMEVDEVVLRLITVTDDVDALVRAIHTRAVGPDGPITPGTRDGYYADTRYPQTRYWKLVGGQDFLLVDGAWQGRNGHKHGPSWWTLTGEIGIDKIEYADLPPGAPV
jgi:alkanesulfonate monooxygenase SsuD/methylene tetrahydromethanopterin reductase-like flavin-dependent oxidoreductase (luciferase family)